MTDGSLVKILTYTAPGETRAIAVDASGIPWRSFLQRWGGESEPARLGQVMPARLRADAEGQGGSFAELESGQEVFLANKDRPAGATLGQSLLVRIVSEQRHGKLARVKPTVDKEASSCDAFIAWGQTLPGNKPLQIEEDREAVDAAFDEALSERVTLAGGGTLYIERTRALMAMDIDTSGRQGKGSAGAKALSVNLAAGDAAARQIALRDLGGAVVIDCLGPLNAGSNQKIQTRFSEIFRRVSKRQIEVLAPSRFGLMQAAIAWGSCPLEDRILDRDGQPSAESQLLEGLRLVQRQAEHAPANMFTLSLPTSVYSAYRDRKQVCELALAQHFSGRVVLEKTDNNTVEIRRS
ncbi:MAG: hypothetical protein Hens3KO_08050 [Henriciella sp.]